MTESSKSGTQNKEKVPHMLDFNARFLILPLGALGHLKSYTWAVCVNLNRDWR